MWINQPIYTETGYVETPEFLYGTCKRSQLKLPKICFTKARQQCTCFRHIQILQSANTDRETHVFLFFPHERDNIYLLQLWLKSWSLACAALQWEVGVWLKPIIRIFGYIKKPLGSVLLAIFASGLSTRRILGLSCWMISGDILAHCWRHNVLRLNQCCLLWKTIRMMGRLSADQYIDSKTKFGLYKCACSK